MSFPINIDATAQSIIGLDFSGGYPKAPTGETVEIPWEHIQPMAMLWTHLPQIIRAIGDLSLLENFRKVSLDDLEILTKQLDDLKNWEGV